MKISDVMTPCPYKIEPSATVGEAANKMALRNIRHLPVVDGPTLVGVVSLRELELAMALGSEGQLVASVCSRSPMICPADLDIAEVARQMADRKVDCALIAGEDESLLGIFTTTDACRLIHLILDELDKREESA